MKSLIVRVEDHGKVYECLAFICPGCREFGGTGLHMLAVNTEEKQPSWAWDGNLEAPTINPSILTGKDSKQVCHSFLHNGKFQFLTDCTHSLAGKNDIPLPNLPDWFIEERI